MLQKFLLSIKNAFIKRKNVKKNIFLHLCKTMLPKDQDPKTRLVKCRLCTNNFSDKVGIHSVLRKKIIENHSLQKLET